MSTNKDIITIKTMKKLLMLGGGFLQKYVISKAKDLGYYVLCLDADPNAVGFKIADEYAVINIVDEDACLAYAREKQVDGVLTAATDFSVLTMSHIAEALHVKDYMKLMPMIPVFPMK